MIPDEVGEVVAVTIDNHDISRNPFKCLSVMLNHLKGFEGARLWSDNQGEGGVSEVK